MNSKHSNHSSCFTVGFKIPTTSGLGNHLFFYVAPMYVAWLTGRKPLILTPKRTKLDRAFNLTIAHQKGNRQCPVRYFRHRYVYAYDDRVKDLLNVAANVSIQLAGAFFSWKYIQPIEDQLRSQLRFHRELAYFAKKFLSENVPHGWNDSAFVHVGVHVRRGDYLGRLGVGMGVLVASKQYLNRSMTYFVERFTRVQFVVASNDITWCQMNIKQSSFNQKRVNITFSIGHSAAQDLALLASCDHSIMSTGTYSWWAAWFANGTTIYYKNFARRGSNVYRRSLAADIFLPTWIGMT